MKIPVFLPCIVCGKEADWIDSSKTEIYASEKCWCNECVLEKEK